LNAWSIFELCLEEVCERCHVISKSGKCALSELSACVDTTLHTQPGLLALSVECECARRDLIWSGQCQCDSHSQVCHILVLSANSHPSFQRRLCVTYTMRTTGGPSTDVWPVHYAVTSKPRSELDQIWYLLYTLKFNG